MVKAGGRAAGDGPAAPDPCTRCDRPLPRSHAAARTVAAATGGAGGARAGSDPVPGAEHATGPAIA